MITRQLSGVNILLIPSVNDNYFCEFKTIDYILAIAGFVILLRSRGKGRLFLSFFLASLIFLPYLARFFSAEGYLPVALLAALALYGLCESFGRNRYTKFIVIFVTAFMLIFSPTTNTGQFAIGGTLSRVFLFDSAPMNMLFPDANARMISSTIWFEKRYMFASKLIEDNSSPDDIVGICLAVVSGRATANNLLPEVYPKGDTDHYADSKIIIMLKYRDPKAVKEIVDKYGLVLLGKNDILDVYKNPNAKAKMIIRTSNNN
jgi:hypothetical protein